MKSSGPLFTRQNPFPPVSTVKTRAHYHPSRKKSLSKKEKKITLSPVRLHQTSNSPPHSLNRESQQLYENHDFPASDGQHVFTEIWPSTECGSSPEGHADVPEMLPDKLSTKLETSTVPSRVKEDSVLAKYIERFRRGRPQSRAERQQMASTDGGEQIPFWWMTHSPVPSSNPAKPLDKDGHDSTADSLDAQPQHDMFFSVGSDCSQEEYDDTDLINLQERASRLLLRGECSPSDGSIPVSSDGLGCSDFSSPVSVDEPVRQPLIPSLMKSTAAAIGPDPAAAAFSQKSVMPTMTPPTRPEDDILFQWRLRRKMEQARGWSRSMKQSGLHGSAFSWQAPSLVHASQQQSSQPPRFSESDAHPHMTASQAETTEAHRRGAPAPSPPRFLPAGVPPSSLMSQTQTLSHIPAHMHLLCDVLPCPNQPTLANDEQSVSQKPPEHQTKAVHRETQVSESLLRTNSDGPVKERLPASWHASSGQGDGPSRQKIPHKNKKKKLVTKESEQKTAPPSRQQRKAVRDSSYSSNPKNTAAVKEQHHHEEGKAVPKESCTGSHGPPSSPVHAALGQVVSEVLFPTAAQKTPVSSVSTPRNISSSSGSPVPLNVTQNSLEVISQLLQEAEDSDGQEFEDDPLLQVLRQQRKWVKDQIREVDVRLNEYQGGQAVA
ncbi:proline and serine-rich protein 3 [Poecilia latipinna]|uniref:proline and serine-rich protein 3 n=1 Tax=Poecilia latipinna TaxID=48699 RepID=UPI00072EB43A|nr:PREDICTED: proline and serine-rich protein 3 [Poecilia latipinna]